MNKAEYVKPILLTFAIERNHEGEQKLFYYDYTRDMNVLKSNPEILFVEAGRLASMMTLTKSEREMDSDDERSYAELYTKTDKNREIDDEEFSFFALSELYTKTEHLRERDDEDICAPLPIRGDYS